MTIVQELPGLWAYIPAKSSIYSILPSIILMSVFIDRGRESPFLKVIGRMFLNLLNGNRSVIQV